MTKFQLPAPDGFWAVLKNPAGGWRGGGGKKFAPLVQNRVKVKFFDNWEKPVITSEVDTISKIWIKFLFLHHTTPWKIFEVIPSEDVGGDTF